MKIDQIKLIEDLTLRTQAIIQSMEKYRTLKLTSLNFKATPQSWSILECLEHLNLYGDFYLKEIETRILNAKAKPGVTFESGLLGNYFANSMLPKNGKINKMKTFKDKDPSGSSLTPNTIDRFLKQQQRIIELLQLAKGVDLNKTRTSITVPIIKLKLGDTFRFIIYHTQRHMLQIERVLKLIENQEMDSSHHGENRH